MLLEAKERLPHGEWLPWLRDNCDVPERTCQLYMRVARNRELLEKSATVADLTLRGAAALLAGPREEGTNPDSDPDLDSVASELAALDAAIDDAEYEGLLSRWDCGREILKERDANGGKLPDGLLEGIAEAVRQPLSEVKYSWRFAEAFPDELALFDALQRWRTWDAMIGHLDRVAARERRQRFESDVADLQKVQEKVEFHSTGLEFKEALTAHEWDLVAKLINQKAEEAVGWLLETAVRVEEAHDSFAGERDEFLSRYGELTGLGGRTLSKLLDVAACDEIMSRPLSRLPADLGVLAKLARLNEDEWDLVERDLSWDTTEQDVGRAIFAARKRRFVKEAAS